jgi:hypothetical protein
MYIIVCEEGNEMKILRFLLVMFVMAELSFSWTVPKVNGQDFTTQDDQNKKILKEAVVGAGVGAIASGASGGSAGKGALIGAGTNVIGNALVDTLTSSPQQPQGQVQFFEQPQPQVQFVQPAPERGYDAANSDSAPRRPGCGSGRR